MNPCILIFGMPRSGTTWVGKLFDSHPDTLYRHEPDSVVKLHMPLFPEPGDAARYQEELQQFVASLARVRDPEVVGKQPLFPKSYASTAGLFAYRGSVLAAKAASRAWRHFPCLYRPTGAGVSQVRLVWKSVESSGRLGLCVSALPDARAIHLIRHPCGQIASVLRGDAGHRFADTTPSADQLWVLQRLLGTPAGKASGLTLDALDQLAPEERLAWRWVLIQEKILADVANCPRVLTVRYEDVCADPVGMTRRMFGFAGLRWHQQSDEFIRTSTMEASEGYYSVFKRSRAIADRWRSELAPAVQERVVRILRSSQSWHLYADDRFPAAPTPARAIA